MSAPAPSDGGRVWSAWLAAMRQELSAPAEALVRGSQVLQQALPADAPPKFAEAAANIQTRSRQLRDLIAQLTRPTTPLTETQEKTLRHDLRGHAAYVIGMCHLWSKQLGRYGLDRFGPALERLEE